jgi:hypothetical protein
MTLRVRANPESAAYSSGQIIVGPCSPWEAVSDALSIADGLLLEIPGWDGYERAPETEQDLRDAAAAMQKAIALLRQAEAREDPRYWASEAARVEEDDSDE